MVRVSAGELVPAMSSEMRAGTWQVMRAGCWGVACLLLLAGQAGAGQMPSMVMVKEEGGRLRREVGPVVQGKEQGQEPGQEKKKYRRLEHSIMVQADIRSRLDQEQEQEQE